MGYTTTFTGKFTCTPALNTDQVAYLKALCETRRMKRSGASKLPDPLRNAVGLPIGHEGEYFVGGTGWAGQDHDETIVGFNTPPASQPSLWCQWTLSEDGKFIKWDGGEKFYEYIAWIKYFNEHFFKPWGVKLAGDVKWYGEDPSDRGVIVANKDIACLTHDDFAKYKQNKRLEREAKKQNKTLTTAIGKTANPSKTAKI